jgi:glycosyltransferase involved in cell wall biosynthesis
MAYGGQLRAFHIGRALKDIGDVTAVVVNADPIWPDAVERTAAEFTVAAAIKGAAVNGGLGDKVQRALNPRFQNVHDFFATDAERRYFAGLARDADLIWFMRLRSANVLDQWRWPKSVMDIDDVPSTYAQRVSLNASRAAERAKARWHMWIERRRERLLLERFTVLSVSSQIDREVLGFPDRLHVIPNGFERPRCVAVRRPSNPPRIGFIGLYSYAPNRQGVQWFLDNCLPRLRSEIADVRLRLVGAGTDGPSKPSDPSVDALGWVQDTAAEMATWSLMIVPIQTGGGTRLKILDAFSRKCPVVSTRFGAQGYELENGRELLLADSPDDFAAACVSLIRNSQAADQMAEQAFESFVKKWTWEAITPRVRATAEDCLRREARVQ